MLGLISMFCLIGFSIYKNDIAIQPCLNSFKPTLSEFYDKQMDDYISREQADAYVLYAQYVCKNKPKGKE